MSKELSEMSIEELWELFPIVLTEHQAFWKQWYLDEESTLKKILPSDIRINHIGSTAIETIWAKPIIDILVEITIGTDLNRIKEIIIQDGYLCMSQSSTRISFNKGYTKNGFAEKVFHLHLRYMGDNDELYFRDYLNEHLKIAKEYEGIKLNLWKRYEHNRDGYTSAKTDIITKYTREAKQIYGNRYS